MRDQHPAIVEMEEKILCPPAEARDAPPGQRLAKPGRKGKAQIRAAQLHAGETPAREAGFEGKTNGFDFGQLGHAP